MKREFFAALRATLFTLVLTGLAYPLVLTALALGLFPDRARGSLVTDDAGHMVGSALIGQPFTSDAYLQPRPSAVSFDGAGSGGSNLGPTSKALRERIEKARVPGIPAELLTTSGSGLDPHISPAAALWQVSRIAKARGVSAERVQAVIESNVEGRDLWVLGEPRVNVLLVNLALDRHFGAVTAAAR